MLAVCNTNILKCLHASFYTISICKKSVNFLTVYFCHRVEGKINIIKSFIIMKSKATIILVLTLIMLLALSGLNISSASGNVYSQLSSNNSQIYNQLSVPVMYSVNYESNNLTIIDPRTDMIMGDVNVGLYPDAISVSPNANLIAISNSGSNSIYFLNAGNGTFIKSVNTSKYPSGSVFSLNGSWLFVANSASSNVSVINISQGKVVKSINVGNTPTELAEASDGDIFVADSGNGEISVLNQTGVLLKNIFINYDPTALIYDPVNNYIYVTDSGNELLSLSASSLSVVSSLKVGSYPDGISINSNNSQIYVISSFYGNLSVISTNTFKLIREVYIPPASNAVEFYDSKIYVSFSGLNVIEIYNSTTLNVVGTINTGLNPYAMGISLIRGYVVSLKENGLPTGTLWGLNIGYEIIQSYNNTINVTEPNGSYFYTTMPLLNYQASWYYKQFKIMARGLNLSINFTFFPENPGKYSLYVASQLFDRINFINNYGRSNWSDSIGASYPEYLAYSKGDIYIAGSGSNVIEELNASNQKILRIIPTGIEPLGIESYGSNLYIAIQGSNILSVFNTSSQKYTGNITLGSQPTLLSISPDGSMIAVTNYGSNSVSIINRTSLSLIDTLYPGLGSSINPAQPFGVYFGTNIIAVSDIGQNQLVIFNSSNFKIIKRLNIPSPYYLGGYDIRKELLVSYASDKIAIINSSSLKYLGNITVQGYPTSFLQNGNKLITSLSVADKVAIINMNNLSVTKEINVGGDPEGLALNGSKIFVADTTTNNLTEINMTDYDKVNITLGGIYPQEIISNGNLIFTSDWGSNDITEFNTFNNSQNIIKTGIEPYGMAIYAGYLYVVNWGSASVSVINLFSSKLIRNISVGQNPYCIAVMPSLGEAFVTNELDGNVSVINLSNNEVTGSIDVGLYPIPIVSYGNMLFVGNWGSGNVTIINASSLKILGWVTVGQNPTSMAISPDGSDLYVANLDGYVSVINLTIMKVIETIPVGLDPLGIAVSQNSNYVYVTNSLSNNITIIDTRTFSPAGSLNVSNPWGIVVTNNQTNYTISFIERGLQNGTEWNIELDNLTYSSFTKSISINISNGIYNLFIPSIYKGENERFSAFNNYSFITVDGSNITIIIVFNEEFLLNISSEPFNGGNLSPTSGWYIKGYELKINAYPYTGNKFNEWIGYGNGSYTGTNNPAVITINGPIIEIAYFESCYYISVIENGLPPGTIWYISLTNGQSFNSTNKTINFIEPNGTYSYTLENPVYIGDTYRFITLQPSGTLKVNGTNVTIIIEYQKQYYFNITSNPLDRGTVYPSGGWYNASSILFIKAFPNPNYEFLYWSGTGNGSYSGVNNSAIITINGPITEIANFVEIYTIKFNEAGLPSGTQWSLNLGNITKSSTNSTIILQEPNETYSYSIETIISGSTGIRYISSLSSGTITVDGFNITVNVSYTEQYYLEMLSNPSDGGNVSPQSGWYNAGSTVTINAIPNSNFEFKSWTGTGNGSYSGINNQVTITINSPITEQANFIELYSITFTESGLPAGTIWYVNTSNGQSYSSSGTSISVQMPNGSYSYTIATADKEYSAQGGLFIVNGSDMEVNIKFNPVTYAITFSESGLPSGTSWSLTLDNITESSTNGTIIFNEPNGTYSYSISGIPGYRTTSYSGTVIANGNTIDENITWSVILYPITITENGIPNGTSWSATITGMAFNGQYINVTLYSKTNTLTFNEPNGSYSYTIHLPPGYSSSKINGNFTVSGDKTISNLMAEQNYNYMQIIISAILMFAGVLIVLLILKKKRNHKNQ